MARQNNRSILGGPSIFNLSRERCCGKADGKWSVVFWLDKVKVDDDAEGWPWRTILYRERNRLPKHQIARRGLSMSAPGDLCVWCGSLQADRLSRWLTGFSEVLCTRIR